MGKKFLKRAAPRMDKKKYHKEVIGAESKGKPYLERHSCSSYKSYFDV